MKYPQDLSGASQVNFSASGAIVGTQPAAAFEPRLPSTWPPVAMPPGSEFVDIVEQLFTQGMLDELEATCSDILAQSKTGLQGRGHVIGIAMLSALDSLSQFAYPSERQHIRIPQFVQDYFPQEFDVIRQELNTGYRNGLIHEWFMREVAFLPGKEPISIQTNGSPVLGLLTFKAGLIHSVGKFVETLRRDENQRAIAARRYTTLQTQTRT